MKIIWHNQLTSDLRLVSDLMRTAQATAATHGELKMATCLNRMRNAIEQMARDASEYITNNDHDCPPPA